MTPIETPADKFIIAAFATKKISECSPRELDIHIVPAVNNAFKFVGKRETDSIEKEVEFILENLPNELRNLLPSMRAGEIPLAIKRGLLKEYGDYYGLNVAELLRFCKCYMESESRIIAAKQMLKPVEKPQLKPSKDYEFELFKNNLLIAYKKNSAGQSIETNGPSLYEFCNKLGLIKYSGSEKYEIMQDAARAIIRDKNLILAKTFEDFERKPHKRVIDILTAALENNKPVPNDIAGELVAKSKYLTLKSYLQEIETNGLNLSEIVDAKKELFFNEA